MKTYLLNPNMTFATVTTDPAAHKFVDPVAPALAALVNHIAPAPRPVALPPRQPLPTATFDPAKPALKLGLDVHLEFMMVVAQKDHASAQAPRKFSRAQLVEQVRQWVAEGRQVFCVQESCGFGRVASRTGRRRRAKFFDHAHRSQRPAQNRQARRARRLSRWLDGNRDELAPIRIPTETEQRQREGTRRRKFLGRQVRALANRGHGQVAEYCHVQLPSRWWGARNWLKLAALDPWIRNVLAKLRDLIVALEAQLVALETELVARVKDQERPKGLGEITLVTLEGEVCDWARFSNRKASGGSLPLLNL